MGLDPSSSPVLPDRERAWVGEDDLLRRLPGQDLTESTIEAVPFMRQ